VRESGGALTWLAAVYIFAVMDFDISDLLSSWEFQPGQVLVRRFTGQDGREKLQLRVDLGLLQMNMDGRPDGKRPHGYDSLFDYYQAKLHKHVAEHDGSDEGFKLKAEDCARLQLEALQYHQRYFCLLQLEEYDSVIRDGERNLVAFEFVSRHAETEELAWSLLQFQPQLLMVMVRARAAQALQTQDFDAAIRFGEEGIESIRKFFQEHGRGDVAEQSGEILSLESWLSDIRSRKPLSPREKLERALNEAIQKEDYEQAAKYRDELKNLRD